jgi:hypothetical protein
MADIIAITALVVAVFGALGACIRAIHLRKVNCGCINSSCVEERSKSKSSLTPPQTPIATHHHSQETKISDEQLEMILKRLTATATTEEINYVV